MSNAPGGSVPLCASCYSGQWVTGVQWGAGKYSMMIEDPFCYTENTSRSLVAGRLFNQVANALKAGAEALSQPPKTNEAAVDAAIKIFGIDALKTQEEANAGYNGHPQMLTGG
eukprot:CAMPEP_0197855570 /NCGR_PEP_ID=MMETSP1438-20131217/26892_1 /TAXON_ID=1461541 /ORGANISM="Pterosperma sp., Strain CCMP1384" /LENGTH=112 /DNA_ID=CAMNT_0043470741 /DNA_START=30 /DNA_END=364 /DNA_ORIENTATION=-